jgi:serine/threonine-protein kinase
MNQSAANAPGEGPGRRVATRVPSLPDDQTVPPRQAGRPAPSLIDQLEPKPDTSAPSTEEGTISGQARYRVREEVGKGGMGKVLRVEDTDLNREIAMKVLLGSAANQGTMRRFIEEAQISSQLEHPNMLPVHDFGINEDGDIFFTMQYVRSHDTIGEIVERLRAGDREAHRRYTFERRVQIMQQVCHALAYAHERGVVHRDIKPSNIMVGEHGEVFVVDWGIAKLAGQAERDAPQTLRQGDEASPDKTRQGTLVGTPPYMSPEQIAGFNDEVDAISDVYAVTTVLYEFLTLNYYLGALKNDLAVISAAVLHRKPADAESHLDPLNGRVPRQLSRICRRGLSKPREKRFQSARELAEALQLWLEGNAPVVCPGTGIQRGLVRFSKLIDRHPVLIPAVAITASILLVTWLVLATALVLGLVSMGRKDGRKVCARSGDVSKVSLVEWLRETSLALLRSSSAGRVPNDARL